jgi:hypothetical protein
MENDSSLTNLVREIALALVDDPDSVEVTAIQSEASEIIQIKVAEDDRGKVIGKSGRIAKAIRTLVRAAAAKEGKRTLVEIID